MLLAGLLLGCGGRVVAEGRPDAMADAQPGDTALDRADVSADVPPGCAPLDDGTAVCGFGCGVAQCGPELAPCAPFTVGDEVAKFGVCYKDLRPPPGGGLRCTVCAGETSLCVNSTKFSLLCVQRAICERLAKEGMTAACFFTDKTPWDPKAVIPTPSCPADGGKLGMCGGACGNCGAGTYCTGRSLVHPFGVCLATLTSAGKLVDCDATNPCTQPTDACMTFKVGAGGDQKLADKYGACIEANRCRGLRASLPGGVFCKDAKWVDMP